ncbi:MAG: alpha/beta hydrolase [Caldilineaceae bacterium]|nr:alpha/beta hydrolase [Caldilineaceae bacterium]
MTTWTHATIHANGIDIHYHRTGGDKPQVVMLHGLTDNGACWTRLANELAADYDCILPDARGHGKSSAPADGYSFEEQANDVIAFIKALNLDRPVLIGHSLGGAVSAQVAAKAPESIRGAILEDPAFITAEPNPQRSDWPDRHGANQAMSHADLMAKGRAENPLWAADTFDTWATAKHEARMEVFNALKATPPDFRSTVARFGVPVLMITGDDARGVVVSAATAAELQALNPHLSVVHVPGAGHCIRYEQPDRVAEIVKEFLSTVK